MKTYKSMVEIKQSVSHGVTVYWMHKGYNVVRKPNGEYFIHSTENGTLKTIDKFNSSKAYFSDEVMI